jgi:predicted Zn-dependent protease
MQRVHILGVIATLAAALLLSGCATTPYTDRTQLMLVSADSARQMADETAQQILKEEPVSNDPQYVQPVQEIGRRIAEVADRPEYAWEFHVIAKPDTVNAFALPGGKVFVYTGLIELSENNDQLAAVIGHEVAHAIARHGSERMSQQLMAQVGYQAAAAAVGAKSGAAMQAFQVGYGLTTQVGVLLPFSRKHEHEADKIGMILMAKAGYNPEAAIEFWRRMSQKSDGESPPAFLSTHPTNEDRIAALQDFLPRAMDYYKQR